jgi:glycosyltransferase involved in cell wall biosynthesis
MKILLVHNSYQQPGGEDVVFEQERQLLVRAGHNVVTYSRSNWEADSYSGIRRLSLAWRTVWAEETRRKFAQVLSSEKPDLVHVHNTLVMISPSIYSACREARVPVVQTLHNYRLLCPTATFFRKGHICEECLEHSLWRSIHYGCYRDSRPATAVVALMLQVHRSRHTWTRDVTCYIALTAFGKSKFVEGGIPADRIFVKPNFVHPDPGRRNGCGEGKYALFVGRLAPEKRVSTLLRAWALLRSSIPLQIVGGGPERQELEAESQRLGLRNVHFRGQLSRDEVLATTKGARLLIFSSEWYEGFSMVIVEAFACGVPIICASLPAQREIVEHGRTGLLFTPGKSEDLAEKVEWAWNNPGSLRLMADAAREEYKSKYTAERNYPILMGIYQSALARNATGPSYPT